MFMQLSFEFENLLQPPEFKKKRIRYNVPTYIKFYSIYQYDREKFTRLMKEWLKTKDGKERTYQSLRIKQKEILEQCYIRDEQGKKLRDCDEKHIFRAGTLQKIMEEIFRYTGLSPIDLGVCNICGLKAYPCESQAEIDGSWQMPIRERVIIHIELLRLLRKGYSIENAMCKIKERANEIY